MKEKYPKALTEEQRAPVVRLLNEFDICMQGLRDLSDERPERANIIMSALITCMAQLIVSMSSKARHEGVLEDLDKSMRLAVEFTMKMAEKNK